MKSVKSRGRKKSRYGKLLASKEKKRERRGIGITHRKKVPEQTPFPPKEKKERKSSPFIYTPNLEKISNRKSISCTIIHYRSLAKTHSLLGGAGTTRTAIAGPPPLLAATPGSRRRHRCSALRGRDAQVADYLVTV